MLTKKNTHKIGEVEILLKLVKELQRENQYISNFTLPEFTLPRSNNLGKIFTEAERLN